MSRKSSKSNAANDAQEKYSAEIREFQTAIPENKKCFECDQRGKEEFYVFKQVKKKKKKNLIFWYLKIVPITISDH